MYTGYVSNQIILPLSLKYMHICMHTASQQQPVESSVPASDQLSLALLLIPSPHNLIGIIPCSFKSTINNNLLLSSSSYPFSSFSLSLSSFYPPLLLSTFLFLLPFSFFLPPFLLFSPFPPPPPGFFSFTRTNFLTKNSPISQQTGTMERWSLLLWIPLLQGSVLRRAPWSLRMLSRTLPMP